MTTDLAARQDYVDLIARQVEEIAAVTGGNIGEIMAVSMSVVISLMFFIANGNQKLAANLLEEVARSSIDCLRAQTMQQVDIPPNELVH